jgi:FMN phosphatase YigB (HAD superfamily)
MKSRAIIVDVDGTLANKHPDRSPYEFDKVAMDSIHEDIAELVNMYAIVADDSDNLLYTIIIVSGREDICRLETENWLDEHGVLWDTLFMRKAGDFRKDVIVKKEIYDQEIKGNYDVRLVIDDRDQVVEMWRELGLRCIQVAPGNF